MTDDDGFYTDMPYRKTDGDVLKDLAYSTWHAKETITYKPSCPPDLKVRLRIVAHEVKTLMEEYAHLIS